MKKLAVISMLVAATGLCFADSSMAQEDLDLQDQYAGDQAGGSSGPAPTEDRVDLEADNDDGIIGVRIDHLDGSLFSVLLISASHRRSMFDGNEILEGARLAGIGGGEPDGFSVEVDLRNVDYEGFLWMQAVIFTRDGRVLVSDIKRLTLGDNALGGNADEYDPGNGSTEPDGGATGPSGSDDEDAGLRADDKEQAKA